MRRTRLRFRSALFAWGTLLPLTAIVACQAPDDAAAPSPADSPGLASAATGRLSTPFDLSAVVAQARHAFRREGEAWVSGDRSYTARATAQGVAVAPIVRGGVALAARPGAGSAESKRGAPLEIRTESVGRRDALGGPEGQVAVDRDGHLTIARGRVVEHLRSGEEGLEQSWSFAERPDGAGDLVVRVRAEGEGYSGATAAGLHFVDARTGLGVRYGVATFVDARGARTVVSPTFEDGSIVIRVPKAVIDGAEYPAVLDPVIGSELGMDVPVPGITNDSRNTPSFAYDPVDGVILATWWDLRPSDGQENPDIYGARLRATDGALLDATAFPISSAAYAQTMPRATFNGTDFVVVWEDARGDGTTTDVYGARVTATGTVKDPAGILLAKAPESQNWPEIACAATNCLVTWTDYRNNTGTFQAPTNLDVYAVRFDSGAGAPVGSSFPISNPAGLQVTPAVRYDGTNFMVVWADNRVASTYQLYAARVTTAGGVLASDTAGVPLAVSSNTGNKLVPGLSFDGTNLLVTWTDYRNGGTDSDIYGAVIRSNLTTVTADIAVCTASGNQDQARADFDGTNHLVVWSDSRGASPDIYGARVSAAGVRNAADANGIGIATTAGAQVTPALVYVPSLGFVVGDADGTSPDNPQILLNLVASNGAVNQQNFLVSRSANRQVDVDAAFDGTNYFVVWSDGRNDLNPTIHGARVDPSGALLDSPAIALSVGSKGQFTPRVAFDQASGKYLVVWADFRNDTGTFTDADIYGALVTKAGGTTPTQNIQIARAAKLQRFPSVAADSAGRFLVVWESEQQTGTVVDIAGARVDGVSGTVTAANFALPTLTTDRRFPDVASAGSNFMVAYEDHAQGVSDVNLMALRTDPLGIALGSPFVVTSAPDSQLRPHVASDGTSYAVVYLHARTATARDTRFAVYKASDASPVGSDQFLTQGGELDYPRVAFDGTHYVAVWKKWGAGIGGEIQGGRFTPQGVTLDAPGFLSLAADAAQGFAAPSIAANPQTGRSLLVYPRFDSAAATRSFRIRGRFLSNLRNGQSCAQAAECASNVCSTTCQAQAAGGDASSDVFVGDGNDGATSSDVFVPDGDGASADAFVPDGDGATPLDGGFDGNDGAAPSDGGPDGSDGGGSTDAAPDARDGSTGQDASTDAGPDAAKSDAATDASSPDAAGADAASPPDGGGKDAAVSADASDTGSGSSDSGCSCKAADSRAAGGNGALALGAFVGLALLRRRRR